MSCKVLLIFTIVAFSCYADVACSKEKLKEVLKKFRGLLEEHDLNITIILSQAKFWSNGQLKQVEDIGYTIPMNNIQLQESKLTEDMQRKWVTETEKMVDNGVSSMRLIGVEKDSTITEASNWRKVLRTPSYERVVNFANGSNRFVMTTPTLIAARNFEINQGDIGRVQVITANLKVFVDENNGVPDENVDIMIKDVRKIWMMYSDEYQVAKALGEVFDKKIPGFNWQVIIGANDIYYKAAKYVQLRLGSTKILVYSLKI